MSVPEASVAAASFDILIAAFLNRSMKSGRAHRDPVVDIQVVAQRTGDVAVERKKKLPEFPCPCILCLTMGSRSTEID